MEGYCSTGQSPQRAVGAMEKKRRSWPEGSSDIITGSHSFVCIYHMFRRFYALRL
jgi:hypothetical protein